MNYEQQWPLIMLNNYCILCQVASLLVQGTRRSVIISLVPYVLDLTTIMSTSLIYHFKCHGEFAERTAQVLKVRRPCMLSMIEQIY